MKRLNKKVHEFQVNICTVNRGQVLAFEDTIDKRFHIASAKCISSKGQLYVIRGDEFTFKMSQDKKTWEFLKTMAEEQDQILFCRQENNRNNYE